jgi:hypothetical protein
LAVPGLVTSPCRQLVDGDGVGRRDGAGGFKTGGHVHPQCVVSVYRHRQVLAVGEAIATPYKVPLPGAILEPATTRNDIARTSPCGSRWGDRDRRVVAVGEAITKERGVSSGYVHSRTG